MSFYPSISIIGATGAVGEVFLKILEERKHPVDKIRLLASKRSAGKLMQYMQHEILVEETTEDSVNDSEVVFISANSDVSKKFTPLFVKKGSLVIDDGSAFRMEEHVPLVVPEVNEKDIDFHKGIISIPNCTTTPLVMALHSLRQISKIERVQVSTYQAVSGSGALAVSELEKQTKEFLNNERINNDVYPHQIAFSLIPQIDEFEPDGYTKEEHKIINETKKILHDDSLKISATCVRVPVFNCHSEVVTVDFNKEVKLSDVLDIFSDSSGIGLFGTGLSSDYPTPSMVEGQDDVFIGRIRQDKSNPLGLNFWLVSDNLRKGAALNAIQIMESAVKLGKVPKFNH